MKALITAASALALAALLPAAASAQTAPTTNVGTTFYGTLGYADSNTDHLNLGTIQGRVGARFGQYFGVEGELGAGVTNDKTTVGGIDIKAKIQNQEAIYGVGFLPLSPEFELLARIGYGDTRAKAKASAFNVADSESGNSWNYGVGGQYHFDDKNGVRADYTREEYTGSNSGAANVYALSYVRKF
ncbi:MAG TPA: porin family protein [Phenylobacterium sp.]|jgi:outer membrane immunogenic protein|nr:porin family protein [Phenylobacterium sp.]